MHFITFPVVSTNIFPLSNSTRGGQLVTEYNLKSREMVATNPSVKYAIGPSYVHSMDDFKVSLLEDTEVDIYDATKTYAKGDYCKYNNTSYICTTAITTPEAFNVDHWSETVISTSILQIGPGRAVVNGHFIESLTPVIIDLNLANAELHKNSQEPLYGNLSIGLKAYFSTENTMSGSMLVENEDNMYIGIQVVITKAADFKVPGDDGCMAENEQSNATADIKLADFTYINGTISKSSILPNVNATRYIPSERIYDFNSILDSTYVTSNNLVDTNLYVMSGKSESWCDATESLMVWDTDPTLSKTLPTTTGARFTTDNIDGTGNVKLVVPHKQIDGLTNDNGDIVYYQDKVINLPVASYSSNTSGVVTKEYTQKIKAIADAVNTYKQFTNGKQVGYVDILSRDSEGNYSYAFPTDFSNLNVGDYILVREDYTVPSVTDSGMAPSTMYVVLPAGISGISWNGQTKPSGISVGTPVTLWQGIDPQPTESSPSAEELQELFSYNSYRGSINDYFELYYRNQNDTSQDATYYYKVTSIDGQGAWSSAILLTGGMYLATETQIGGFYNASSDSEYIDAGYVYLDDTGHLRLRDYALLRSGALAYQLGEDFRVPANNTLEYVQSYLNENVNERVAFEFQPSLTSTPSMIDIYIPLPVEEGVLNIYDIDSRFGTGVYIHFTTEDKTADYSNLVINIVDCEKIRIDNSITTWTNGPVINLFRSCLYYDAEMINYILTCDDFNDVNSKRRALFPAYNYFSGFENLTLWYARFSTSDPDLIVNGMEISQPNATIQTEEISFWDEAISGDNHYKYALRSITLSGSGLLIGCSLFVSNGSTQQSVTPADVNATTHTIIGDKWKIPQGSELNYPLASVSKSITVTGIFTTAYLASNEVGWIVTDTTFTAKSGIYDIANGMEDGSIAFNSSSYFVPATYTHMDSIGGWAPNSYHIFYGGTTL